MTKAVTVAALALISACGNQTIEPNPMLEAVKGLYFKASGSEVESVGLKQILAEMTPETLAQIPQRVIVLEWEKVKNAVGMSKVAENAGVETYFDQGRTGILMRGGIIISTRGFGNDLLMVDVTGFQSALAHRSQYTREHHLLDSESQITIHSYRCKISVSGRIVIESCTGSSDAFENAYVLGPDGTIQSSRQWITPEVGYFRIVQLK